MLLQVRVACFGRLRALQVYRCYPVSVRGPQDPSSVADAELAQVNARGRHLKHGLRQHGPLPLPQPRGGLPGIQAGTYSVMSCVEMLQACAQYIQTDKSPHLRNRNGLHLHLLDDQ